MFLVSHLLCLCYLAPPYRPGTLTMLISAPGRLTFKSFQNPTKMKLKLRAPWGRQLLDESPRSNWRPSGRQLLDDHLLCYDR